MKRLLLGILLMSSMFTFAQEDKQGKQGKGIGKVIKEIFVKGSIDGKSLFMVYGFEDSSKDMKTITKNAVKMKQLIALGDAIYDKDHKRDYVDAVKDGYQDSKDIIKSYPEDMKDMIKWPWHSLKRMKKSYKVSFKNAKDAYYHSSNPIAGSVKWSGHAIWAQVKGAYFLVIEVPVVTAAAATVMSLENAYIPLSIPFQVVAQTAEVVARTLGFVLRTSIIGGAKYAVAAAEGAYSAISTTTAATLTLIASGGLAVYHGGKWLVSTLPKKIANPVSLKVETNVDVDDQQDFAKKVEDVLKESARDYGLELKVSKINDYSSKFILGNDEVEQALTFTTNVEKKKVKLEGSGSRKFIKSLRKDGKTKQEAKDAVEKMIKELSDCAVNTVATR